ncbi:hypothetical protein EJ06DRAFT_465447, partial [Trichodelitschia bisporula]
TGDGHTEEITGYLASLSQWDVLLGMPWLDDHNPDMKPQPRRLTFNSDFCLKNCCAGGKP